MNTEKHPWIGAIILLFGRNILTTLGAVLATVSFFGFVILMFIAPDSPYIGLLVMLVMPALFILGLLLIPIGLVYDRVTGRSKKYEHPERIVIDLHNPRVRRAVVIVTALTVINIIGVSAISYEGIHYMESPEFCGTVCHSSMEPEFTAYQHSPHANIRCVECHVGPGLEWMIQSKVSGINRIVGELTGEFNRPIKSPAHEMPFALDTCAGCHSVDKDTGDRLMIKRKYMDDEENTPVFSALLIHLGGAQTDNTIHGWHLAPGREIYYLHPEEYGDTIPYVRVKDSDGTVNHYTVDGFEGDGAALPEAKLHRMDCIDCHNRPSHRFDLPEDAVDKAITAGDISRELPYIKSASVDALKAAAETGEAEEVAAQLRAYYSENHPDLDDAQNALLQKAIDTSTAIFKRNIFPKMNITWGTYPDHSGHINTPGCFRCHDDNHRTPTGAVIAQDCAICHEVIAWDEMESDFITMLNLPIP